MSNVLGEILKKEDEKIVVSNGGKQMPDLKIIKNDNKLLNMDEASNLLGLKKSTLYQLVMRKQITHVKLGKLTRFRPEDIQAYINKNLVEVRQ